MKGNKIPAFPARAGTIGSNVRIKRKEKLN